MIGTDLLSPRSVPDDDEGQFEPEEDETDRNRRMESESPMNKVQPIPDATAFFILQPQNQ